MPLVANSDLPAYSRLTEEGQDILTPARASSQDIRELHIGLLNMMPDAALEATERQFLRLIGNSSRIVQIYVHFFTLAALQRSDKAKAHIEAFYKPFDTIQQRGLDGLIISGANVEGSDLTHQDFWAPLCKVIDWANDNVTSTIFSCLATHAAFKHLYGIDRRPLPQKRWGIYEHYKADKAHPLLRTTNTCFYVPHSRHNEISHTDFVQAGAHILVESEAGGVHMATSEDRFRFVFFQGHPEYDTHSLLKEYKREVMRFQNDERNDYPLMPENYFSLQSRAILEEFKERLVAAKQDGRSPPSFPEQLIMDRLSNTWRDSSKSIINAWIGKVYQVTNVDRRKPFMDGIDPADPLGIKAKG